MKQINSVADIKQLGTILGVWAHPDDESFSCAGIMAAAVKNGQKVFCVTATKGEAGVQDEKRWPAPKLGQIRAKEMDKACHILGIPEHDWLGYHDGQCQKVPDQEATDKIGAIIRKCRPDSIFTFGPEGLTGHLDHQSVSRWVDLATKDSQVTVYHLVENQKSYEDFMKDLDKEFNIYFNIDMPPIVAANKCDIAFVLTPDLIKKKHAALRAMPSQTEALFKAIPKDLIDSVFSRECYVKAD